jgi:putative addiction module component (TIGR02574 family)
MLGPKDVERLKAEALALEPEDRAALVDALLESIDADEVVTLSPTFRAELQRRCGEVERGEVEPIPAEVVLAELRAMIA